MSQLLDQWRARRDGTTAPGTFRPLPRSDVRGVWLAVVFGRAVRVSRIALGMTQARLAERVGIHRPIVGRIESGARGTPRMATLLAFRDALGWTHGDLQALLDASSL